MSVYIDNLQLIVKVNELVYQRQHFPLWDISAVSRWRARPGGGRAQFTIFYCDDPGIIWKRINLQSTTFSVRLVHTMLWSLLFALRLNNEWCPSIVSKTYYSACHSTSVSVVLQFEIVVEVETNAMNPELQIYSLTTTLYAKRFREFKH